MDLICYTYSGWDPRIRPASVKRDWMEASTERFAYRCLPLAIANAHGWELLSPCGFAARWNGGPRVEDVEIRLDPGTDPRRAAVSLFGLGTVTFHIEGIFRTPEGWNLWVGGSPNHAKDGIAALNAVIETDWSPYTFTMNWRFTRAGEWIRFEQDEPIAFFFPVQRNVLTGVAPRVVPIDEAPALKEEFEAWSRSRDAFQAWVRETRPTAPADKWQKLYYRGMRPGERPGAPDHQAKLRVRAFEGCPAHRPVPAPRESVPTEPEPPARGPDPRRTEPATDAGVKRRDWILSVMESQRRLAPDGGGIERVRGLSSEEFLERFYAPGRPVVIEGELDAWPALDRWTPAYLADKVGKAEIEVQTGRDANAQFELEKDRHKSRLPFDAFIEAITAHAGNDAYLTAYNSDGNRAALAPLDADVRPLTKFLKGAPGMIWVGPIATFTPLHFDLTNNLLAQVTGSKRLILLPPSETQYLANERHVFSAVHDIMDDEAVARHPEAAKATTYEVELGPGELIYIPIGWWHQVTALDFSVTFTFTDFLWRNDYYEGFPGD